MNASETHMFNAESVIDLYENLYSDAFKLKRHQCNLDIQHRGLLVCDAFTGSHSESNGHDARRLRWSEACNVELPHAQPGGWSAKGQPCDQIFCHFKERVRERTDIMTGFGQTYFDRKRYEELSLAPTGTFFASGQFVNTCSTMVSLQVNIYIYIYILKYLEIYIYINTIFCFPRNLAESHSPSTAQVLQEDL